MNQYFSVLVLVMYVAATPALFAEDSKSHAIKESYQDAKKNVKKGYRSAKDKVCELVNGKMECRMHEIIHKVENASDEVKDKSND
ncbi:MAG: hypothetical protein ACK5P5_08890 [Pseudobdellovibrionaceae bacterium]